MDERTLNNILFPKLNDAQIAQIEKFAQLKSYKDGEIIAEVGDRDICFFVIKSGKIAIVDRSGGQAGTSSKIENYLGFPTGISGSDLANSAVLQANKFGAQLALSCQVVKLTFEDGIAVLHLGSGEQVTAKCVLIATGVEYLKLNVEGCDRFDGAGVYYAATTTEAQMCSSSQVAVVGGANSAGLAAVFLAEHVEKVWLLIRGDDLSKSMSRYLICRIEQMDNIESSDRNRRQRLH